MIKHPKGLIYLFFTEMWERFSYYGMRAILVLYCVAKTETKGLGFSEEDALNIYAIYTMSVYIIGIIGGYVADRYIGQKKAVMFGGFILIMGHILMTFGLTSTFYSALVLIVIGTAFLKPNISSLVGNLYATGDNRREAGYIIFYMGINLGGMLAPICVSEVADVFGWDYGFAIAAIGMIIGQIIFISNMKKLKEGVILNKKEEKLELLPKVKLNKIEKERIFLLFISFLIVYIFFIGFEQAGGLLNLYTDKFTDRILNITIFNNVIINDYLIPTGDFQALNSFFILTFGGLFIYLLNYLDKKNISNSTLLKFGLSTIVASIGFICMIGSILEGYNWKINDALIIDNIPIRKSNMLWIVGVYFFHTLGELLISPISLSLISKLSPARYTSRLMGLYFLVIGLANFTAGKIGVLSSKWGTLQTFIYLTITFLLIGILFLIFKNRLKKLSHGLD